MITTSRLEPLPHVYPFRFVERTLERGEEGGLSGRVSAVVTANARRVQDGLLAPFTLAEMMAQAALLLQGGDPEIGKTGFLAGLSDFVVTRVPEAGDVLSINVRLAGRLGPAVKFDGRVVDDQGREVASCGITVRTGGP